MPKRKQENAGPAPRPQRTPAKAPQAGDAAGDKALTASDKPNRPPTAFENRLYELCKCIPKGKVSTYGAMAIVLESAPRAVGQALRRNPFCPVVPCHRVVAADLNIGGFSGGWGISDPKVQRKRRLLEGEGVGFEDGGGAAEGTWRVLKQYVVGPEELQGLQQGQRQPAVHKAGRASVVEAAAPAAAGAGASDPVGQTDEAVGAGGGGVRGRKKKRV